MNIVVRNVDEIAFREFKAAAARAGMRLGDALTRALRFFAPKLEAKPAKRMGLLDLKPVSYGRGSERLSENVDEVLYGWRK